MPRVVCLLLCLLVASSLAGVTDVFSTKQDGRATYYDINSSGGGQGMCTLNSGGGGVGPIPAISSGALWTTGAINDFDLYNSDSCGMCVEVRGKGTPVNGGADPVPTFSQIVMITDSCPYSSNPVCTKGHIDLVWPTNRAYDGLWDIEWRGVACPSQIGNIEYAFQGSHKWYMKLQVRNHRVPIRKVTITVNGNSKSPTRSFDNFWVWNYSSDTGGEISGNINLRIEAWDGQVITDSFPSPLDGNGRNIGPIKSTKQFGDWQAASAPPLGGQTNPTPSNSPSRSRIAASASPSRTPAASVTSAASATPSRSRTPAAAGVTPSATPTRSLTRSATRTPSRTPAAATSLPSTTGPVSSVLQLFQYSFTGGQAWQDGGSGPGACGIADNPPPIANGVWSYVGVSTQNYFSGRSCGTCLEVTGADSVPRVVFVTEWCDGCPGNTMIFRGGLTSNKQMTWKAVDCPNAAGQTLMYQSLGGSNEWWVNFRVVNYRAPISSVTFLNLFGRATTPATFASWNDNSLILEGLGQSLNNVNSLTIQVCSVTGQCVTDTISRSSFLSGQRFSGSQQLNSAKLLEEEGVQFDAITQEDVPRTGPLGSGLPNYYNDFRPLPAADTYTIVQGTALRVNTNGKLFVTYDGSETQLNERLSRSKLGVQANSGSVGFGLRTGQGAGREEDRLEWRFVDLDGSKASLQWCSVLYGKSSCKSLGRFDFPSAGAGLDVTILMDLDDKGDKIGTTIIWGKNSRSQTISRRDWKGIGILSYYFDNAKNTVLSNVRVATTEVLTVSLDECRDDAEWKDIFFGLTGLDREKTTVEIQGTSNDNCKAAGHGKELVSALTFAVTSVGQGATAAAQTFFSAASTSTGAAAGIGSTGVVTGGAASAAAGFPAAGAAAGGGGGAAGGLSGGAIAGIVIGSVAGGVLLLGVSAIVVGAVVVGAVVLSQSDDDDSSAPSGGSSRTSERRGSIRRRISNLFGGVNVMGNNPGVHQSITARSPPVKV